ARGGAIFNNSGDDFAMTINYSHFGELLGVALPVIPPIVVPGTSFDVVAAIGANGAGNSVSGTTVATAGGGAIYNNGYLLMNGVSLVANSSSRHGGAFMNTRTTGDPFPQPLGQQVIISNSTFTLNTATGDGGAIYQGNSFVPDDNLMEIRNVTIANNTAASGDGIFNLGDGESSGFSDFDDFYLVNTIIANDSCAGGSLGAPSISGTGNNVVFGGSCDIRLQDGGSTPASTITTDPILSSPELAFNLANIFTVVLSLGNGSSASGTGDNGVCTSFPVLSLDQRNLPLGFRPQGAPNCDIGAYESDQTAPPEINVRDGGDTTDILDGDAASDTGDGTDFGTTPVGTPLPQNFIIQNQGGTDLSVTAIVPPAGFTVGAFPSIIGAGSQITVQVTCTAAAVGTYSGDLIIQNNDSDEDPYNFAITCLVEGPEIEVRDATNALIIADADVTPDIADGTDFGTTPQGTPVTNTFVVRNNGNLYLNLGLVSVADITNFAITSPPAATITAGSNSLMDIQCNAFNVGIFTTTVTIESDDFDENPYTFAIRCEVTATGPQIEVFGNTQPIDDGGGNSPAIANDTDFGTVGIGSVQQRTYTIENNGTADLTINNLITSGAGFSLFTPPPATITAGNSATFVIACDTSAPNSYIGSVEIVNNTTAPTDSYTFNLACLVAEPDMRVSKVDNTDPVPAGNSIIYTVSIQNFGMPSLSATNVVLTEVLPMGFTATAITPSQGTCPATPLTGTFNCTIGTIGAGNTVTVVITGTFDPSTPDSTNATNEAYINYDGFTTGSSGTDADDDDERAIEETVVVAVADVGVVKTVDNPTPAEGGTIIYTIEVENFGPSTATGVNLSDTLPPAGVTFVSLTGACSYIAPTVTCPIGTMLPGATFTATITLTVDAGASALAPIPNTANISSTTLDTNGGNDSSTVDINPTAPAPDINVRDGADTVDIANGDVTPSVTDGTDFGTTTVGNPVTNTFIIENVGTGVLNLPGAIIPTGFTAVAPLPTSPLNPTQTTNLNIECTAAAPGTYSGLIQLGSNDPDENPYTFTITCQVNALVPEINVQGNATTIVNGDNTPDTTDDTDFGATTVGTALTNTFTIQNIGSQTLNITGAVTVVDTTNFSVTLQPAATIAGGGNSTFDVTCTAVGAGSFTTTVSIPNDDSDENPYTFDVTCDVNALAPEINVQGNATTIVNGDNTPDTTDDTDFGATTVGTALTNTFTIQNVGTQALTITGAVTVVDATNFSVTQPTSPIGTGGNSTFDVTCTAVSAGSFTTTVSIPNDDSDENPYTFDVTCTVNDVPEINVQGNGVDIANGDTTPSVLDDTDFGATIVG
ncbi:MAG: choice-of-anchor D domain-containing protein, partial [Anaerolineae bacterium]|nr:choice-of-anchor D domain-containing protein [Anaerolineae bacterium]